MGHILALDLGTTYFKAGLFDEHGALAHVAHHPVTPTHPHPGWWDLDVASFRDAVVALIGNVREQAGDLSSVEAISFATQTNTFTLLDAHDEPLMPFIVWPDTRAADFQSTMEKNVSDLPVLATTGVPGFGPEFTPTKLLWLRDRHPGVYESARRFCLLSDYFTLWLTGEHVTEAGAAGLTGLVDIHALKWWDQPCERFNFPAPWRPRVERAGTPLGTLRQEAADQLGLPRTCRFIVGCLDQYAGAIGAGNVTAGGVSETTGTVLATVRCADAFQQNPRPGVFQGPGFATGLYWQMVFGSTSANLLEAYRNHLPEAPTFDALNELASKVTPGADGLRVSDDADPQQPETLFAGDSDAHDRGQHVRAILEAVAFALADQVEQLCGNNRPTQIRGVGGAARSALWRQIKADVLGCPIVATTCAEPTCLGAALLAAAGSRGASLKSLADEWVGTREPDNPDPKTVAQYEKLRVAASPATK